jgi:hypothetical protein
MPRTPPVSGSSITTVTVPILAFTKTKGALSSAFIARVIHREPLLVKPRGGGAAYEAVRYDDWYWPIYKPETFAERSRQWVSGGETLLGPDMKPLKLPLEHSYLFDCDTPRSRYRR